ncbi:MAG: glycosyl transferase family 2, partial [bacterium]
MANGANLAYPKTVFTEVNGYAGADQIASGDDFFLLHKISDSYPDRIAYLKSKQAIVRTAAQENWSNFLQQRIRWASKSAYYKKGALKRVLALVWCYN